ncbi:MAG: serine/threonine protein kinase [Anaerolineales bacterium]|nr:serine/threonine protein kinase [Anaerolineales bacterium]
MNNNQMQGKNPQIPDSTQQATKAYSWQADQNALAQNEALVAPVWEIGDVILDLYEIKELYSGGGMGLVYKIHHRGWDADLAVKSPRTEYFQTDEHRKNFVREAETWVNLGLHPHIVCCYYVRTLGGIPRVFVEYVEGGSLKEWIDRRTLYQGGQEQALERMLNVAIQFAWGLQYAHEAGLVHQDVKPANVMMKPDGTARVTDFGLAKARSTTGEVPIMANQSILMSAGGMTPAYCSPEQAEHQPLTRKTDIWSWGVSILEMFVGEVTWLAGQAAAQALSGYLETGPEDKAIPAMPAALSALLQRCFLHNPDERPRDMVVIAATMQQIYARETGQAYARPAPQASELQADSINNKALSLYDLGHTAEAEALWQNNLKANPMHLETCYNLGLVEWRASKKDDLKFLKDLQAATASQDDWRLGWLMSQVHLERRDIVQAAAILERLPKDATARPEVATVLRHAGEFSRPKPRLGWTETEYAGNVNSVCLDAVGRNALSGSNDNTLSLWDGATGDCVRTFVGHGDVVESVCLSVDRRFALSGSSDCTLKYWEVATGRCLRTLVGHTYSVNSVCLSADGRYALSGSGDNTLKFWNVSSGQCMRTFTGHTNGLLSVCLSLDGRYALSGSADKTLKLWELATGKCLRTFTGHTEFVNSVCLSADGCYALSGSNDRTLKLWEVATGKCVRTFIGHSNYVLSVCLSADGRYALSGSEDNTLKLWEVATGRCVRTFEGHSSWVLSVSLSADGRYALSGCDYAISGSGDHTLKLWDVSPEYCAAFAVSHIVTSATASQFERLLAEAQAARQRGEREAELRALQNARLVPGYEHNPEIREAWSQLSRQVRRASLRAGWLARTFIGHVDGVNSVCLSVDGRYALSGSGEIYPDSQGTKYCLKLWDMATGKCLRTFEGHRSLVTSVCFSADGRYAFSGSEDNTIKLWELETGKCLRTIEGHTSKVMSVSLSRDGRYCFSASLDKTLRLWDISALLNDAVGTARCLWVYEGHGDEYHRTVCISADGRFALSGNNDKTIQLWELATGQLVRTLAGHGAVVQSVFLGGDGRYALSGSFDKTLKLWEVATGRCLRTFEGHTHYVNSVCLSADGQYALSGSKDTTIKLWDVATGQCLRTFEGHANSVISVCLSGDGRYALSGSEDKTLRLWELDWELEDIPLADWDEGARPYLQNFLTLRTSVAGELPQGPSPTEKETSHVLTRRGKPGWNEDDFQQLLYMLGCAGYGWLRPEGVRKELEHMYEESQAPSSLKEQTSPSKGSWISRLLGKQ